MARYKSREAQNNNNVYRNKYEQQHYDRVTILLPKGKKKIIQEYAKKNNITVTQLIVQLLETSKII